MLGFGVKWPLKVPLSPPSLYPPYPSAPGRLKTAELRWNTLFIHLRAPQKRDIRTPHPLRDTKHSSIHKSIHTFIHSGSPRGEGGRERHSENTHFRAELGAQLLAGLCAPLAFAALFARAARVIVAAIADRKVFLHHRDCGNGDGDAPPPAAAVILAALRSHCTWN